MCFRTTNHLPRVCTSPACSARPSPRSLILRQKRQKGHGKKDRQKGPALHSRPPAASGGMDMAELAEWTRIATPGVSRQMPLVRIRNPLAEKSFGVQGGCRVRPIRLPSGTILESGSHCVSMPRVRFKRFMSSQGGIDLGLRCVSSTACPLQLVLYSWKAGTSRVAITPKEPMWMAGYAARTKPSEGAVHDLWAKALAPDDPTGQRAILVTLDICGIDRDLSNRVRDALKSRHRLDRDRIVLACSHTVCPGRAREPTSRSPVDVRRRLRR